jgi:hypothetical protein
MVELFIPITVEHRLLLAMLGWRWNGTGWHCGAERLDKERLDGMEEEPWDRYMREWVSSVVLEATPAVATHEPGYTRDDARRVN